ncbi:uncharacterized protein KD926_002173 [Aspergillus affinis]|uniref:uncharacterized protein n=1 Tax=Aspergillus affinis TaxID=1070780 RepID=UPI0022FEBC9C|nr:uncharacterized protein KD926_002173 [Aspergillus affinis]KAI9036205.1 hypothetical protein KD926_002173 [Aspergillus affinis]
MFPDFNIWDKFVKGLAKASGETFRSGASMTEAHLTNIDPTTTNPATLRIWEVPKGILSARLTQVMNLFYVCSVALPLITLGPNIPSQGNYSKNSENYLNFDISALSSATAQVLQEQFVGVG